MSMLAEQRRKQKYSTDPRGTNWSRDDNKIGQKLMEKMGWSKGKGLGAKEDGNTEHVGVRFKGDNLGVGCSKKHADNWIAHQDDFDSLLSSLNQDYKTPTDSGAEDNVKVQSLEEKSKVAKGRVHYKKFAKGKDLSRCQGDDMDCIMGKRKSKSGTSTPQSEATSAANSEPEEEQDYGVQTFNSTTNVQDYFAKKMAEIKRLRAGNQGSPVQVSSATETEKEDDEGASNQNDSSNTNSDTQDTNENKERKKSKKKAKKEKPEIESTAETSDVGDCENSSVSSVRKSKKKSKKRKLSDTENTDLESDEHSKKKKKSKKDKKVEVENVSEEEPKKKKKKSKKQKKQDSEDEKNEKDNEKSSGDEVENNNDNKNIKGILKKKKPKVDLGFSGANVLDISGYGKKSDKAPTEESEVGPKKSKKKTKKSKK